MLKPEMREESYLKNVGISFDHQELNEEIVLLEYFVRNCELPTDFLEKVLRLAIYAFVVGAFAVAVVLLIGQL